MIDIRFLRENPDAVRENIRKKFQDEKLPLVDEAVRLDAEKRAAQQECEQLKAARNKLSKANGPLYGQLKKADEAQKAELQKQIEENNAKVKADDDRRAELEKKQAEAEDKLREIMYVIPNIIDPSVPIGPDDSHNVEVQRFGEPVVPDFEIPHHVDIMQSFDGIDKDSAGRVAGMGFYYLLGDIARLHEAVLAYARDFMIDEKHFTYVIPPFMMHGSVVKGVMSFPEMEAMMYKIEGEDLYLIGTSEHTMIGRFIDQIIPEAKLPLTVENVRSESRFHPRCGTSFLLVVVVVSILVNSVVRADNSFARMAYHLLLLPVVVGISYEINRWCGLHDNWLSAALSAPGKWLQHMTTNEPDDGMIECAIRAMELVIPEEKGSDEWGR